MATKRNVAWQTPINLTWRHLRAGQRERTQSNRTIASLGSVRGSDVLC